MKKTPIFATHKKYNAKMVNYNGWELPIYYSSIIKEHIAVRTSTGVFDVSHMGEIRLKGEKAILFANHILTNDFNNIKNNIAAYGMLLNENGNIIDDVMSYKISNTNILICVNASNIEKDFYWIRNQLNKYNFSNELKIYNESLEWGQIAIQGPMATEVINKLYNINMNIAKFHFKEINLLGNIKTLIARTGYTGEDGYEIFIPSNNTNEIYNKILDLKNIIPIFPCGIGSRDSLRIEAGLCLHGNEIHENINPIEAGLNWVIKYNKKENFIGKNSLIEYKNKFKLKKKIFAIKILDNKIARTGNNIYLLDSKIGKVTSGTYSPYLQYPIALIYIYKDINDIKMQKLTVEIRGNKIPVCIHKLPFHKNIQ